MSTNTLTKSQTGGLLKGARAVKKIGGVERVPWNIFSSRASLIYLDLQRVKQVYSIECHHTCYLQCGSSLGQVTPRDGKEHQSGPRSLLDLVTLGRVL